MGWLSNLDAASWRNFSELEIRERVLDTGDRTISIDQIATISVETRHWWLWRALAAIVGLIALYGMSASMDASSELAQQYRAFGQRPSGSNPYQFLAIICLAVAAGAGFVIYWLRSITYLQIGASDGSRTIFQSRNKAFLIEVKTFLLKKINERNAGATTHFHFGDTVAGDKIDGDKVAGAKTVHQSTTHVEGTGHQVIAHSPNAFVGGGPNVKQVHNSPGAQVGSGHVAHGNTNTYQQTHIDYSSVLPQIEHLTRYYAADAQSQHLAQRLSELEALMRSGTPTREGRSRVRDLAHDLGAILQAYPPMVQLFQGVMRLAGF